MNSTLYVKRFDCVTNTDVTEDFVLPDYQPEVRRVIGVKSSAAVDGKYLSGDELEADGGVTYTLLYVDGDGAISQTSQTSSFTAHVPLSSQNSDGDDRYSAADLILSCSAENVTCRVTAPRKITLSSRVKLGLISQKPADVSLKSETGNVRRRTEKFMSASMTELRQTGEVSGEIRERDGMKIVFAGGDICVSDVRIEKNPADKIIVKGDAYITLLMLDPEGGYVTTRGRTPIEEEIALPDFPDASLKAAVFPSIVIIEVGAEDDGMIRWKMEYDLDCDIMKCSETGITSDAYLPDSEEKLTMNPYSAYFPGGIVNGRLTTSANMKIGSDSSYVCSWGAGNIDRCEIRDGRILMTGSAKISVVKSGGGEVSLEDVNIPIRYECEAIPGAANSDDGGLVKRTKVSVADISVRRDGDMLGITAELSIAAAVLGEKSAMCAISIESVPDESKMSNTLRGKNIVHVYIPDQGETAWDVEKKFRLGREAVMEGEAYII